MTTKSGGWTKPLESATNTRDGHKDYDHCRAWARDWDSMVTPKGTLPVVESLELPTRRIRTLRPGTIVIGKVITS